MAAIPDFDVKNIQQWAGVKITERGRHYQLDGKVEELVFLKDGRLGAVVRGSRKYLVAVSFDQSGVVRSDCTCPYGPACKHAVAAMLEYRHRLDQGASVPTSTDAKYNLLNLDESQSLAAEDDSTIEAWLNDQSREQLVSLLLGAGREHLDLADSWRRRINLERGDTEGLMREIRQRARSLMEGPDWEDDYGPPPDYSGLLKMMEQVVPLGLADELLAIMASLIEAVQEQIGVYDHDGEFAAEAAPCYSTAAKILRASTLDHSQKLLWAVDQILADQYDLCDPLEQYLAERHPADCWGEVADELLNRLKTQKVIEGQRCWGRDQLSNLAIHALEESGRNDEVIPLCEREAKLTKSYERLVRHLLQAGRLAEAERHIAQGVAATYKDLPGIASSLRKLRTQMCADRQDWASVLTYHVCEFVETPSIADYKEVKKVAGQMKRWPMVQAWLLEYLQSGALPWRQPGWDWAAPDKVELARDERWKKTFPKVETLIEIAILEKDPAEVVKWHERLPKSGRYGSDRLELKIAEAVKTYAPDRALAIWKRLAEAEIAQTKPAAYQTAGTYLEKAGRLMTELKREPEWRDYLRQLHTANARKKRFIEVLGSLNFSY